MCLSVNFGISYICDILSIFLDFFYKKMIDIENYELWNIKSINNSMPPIIRLEYDLNLDKKEIILHKNLNKNLDDLSIKLKFY